MKTAIMDELQAYRASGTIERCAELAKAEQEGRLHIAPCADGTVIWAIVESEEVSIGEIIQKNTYLHGFTEYVFGEFNKDWFLTRQEAETVLESKSNNLEYVCPVCQNEDHAAGAKYCKICGTEIKEVHHG